MTDLRCAVRLLVVLVAGLGGGRHVRHVCHLMGIMVFVYTPPPAVGGHPFLVSCSPGSRSVSHVRNIMVLYWVYDIYAYDLNGFLVPIRVGTRPGSGAPVVSCPPYGACWN